MASISSHISRSLEAQPGQLLHVVGQVPPGPTFSVAEEHKAPLTLLWQAIRVVLAWVIELGNALFATLSEPSDL